MEGKKTKLMVMPTIKRTLCLRKEEIFQTVSMREIIKVMTQAFEKFTQETIMMPARMRLDLEERNTLILLTPCSGGETENISLKVIYQFAENSTQGLPLIQSLLLVADEGDDPIWSIMNGAIFTALRTDAVSGLATDYLARREASQVTVK